MIKFLCDKTADSSEFSETDISRRVSRLDLFNLDILSWPSLWSKLFHNNSDLYLLLHSLIPTSYTSLFEYFFRVKAKRNTLALEFLSSLARDVIEVTWRPHNNDIKKWEKSNNITKKLFKTCRNLRTSRPYVRNSGPSPPIGILRVKPFDPSSFIRWTSSNFLHAGRWQAYIDFTSNDFNFHVWPSFYFTDNDLGSFH